MRGVAKRLVGGVEQQENKQLLSLHVMRAAKRKFQRLKQKQTLKAKKKGKKEKCASWKNSGEFSLEMGFTSFCILNLENADKLVWTVFAEWRERRGEVQEGEVIGAGVQSDRQRVS